jgi:hypothetical protein
VRRRKGEHKEVFESARKSGFVRVRVDGEIRDLGDSFECRTSSMWIIKTEGSGFNLPKAYIAVNTRKFFRKYHFIFSGNIHKDNSFSLF